MLKDHKRLQVLMGAVSPVATGVHHKVPQGKCTVTARGLIPVEGKVGDMEFISSDEMALGLGLRAQNVKQSGNSLRDIWESILGLQSEGSH